MTSENRESPKSITVVVPCYNERDNISTLYDRLVPVLRSVSDRYEIIMINDGSTDGTLEEILGLISKDHNVKYVSFSRNFGHEAATTAGLNASCGDVTVIIDADLQDPPEVILKLTEKWREGNDIVYAVRSERKGESVLKRFTSRAFYRLINTLSKPQLPVDTGDFRLIDRKALNAFKKCEEVNRFVRGLTTWVGFKQIGVLYSRDRRHRGKTKYSYLRLSLLAMEAICSFSLAPLRLSLIFGGIGLAAAAVLTGVILLQKIIVGIPVQGYALMILSVLFMGSLNILLLGVVAEYIGKIFLETQRRPLYLVEEQSATLGYIGEELG